MIRVAIFLRYVVANKSCGEANPPFTPGFMEFLATWILERIEQANQDKRAISFVVIVPSVHKKDVTVAGGPTGSGGEVVVRWAW